MDIRKERETDPAEHPRRSRSESPQRRNNVETPAGEGEKTSNEGTKMKSLTTFQTLLKAGRNAPLSQPPPA